MKLAPFCPPAPQPVSELLDFSGRVVLVTGARKGIGQGIAIRFAEAGADVVVHARSATDAEATVDAVKSSGLGRRAEVAACDLTDETALRGALRAAEAWLGRIDVLVNNAGAYPVEPILELGPERFEAIVQTNLGTAFRATRVLAESWTESRRAGAVVNVSSIEGTRPAAGHAHYAAGKAALDMLTRSAALELGRRGIRVNGVAPGLVHYPELLDLWPDGLARYRARAPLGREGDRREVADACLFLASPAASWITGVVLPVDGGVSAAPHF